MHTTLRASLTAALIAGTALNVATSVGISFPLLAGSIVSATSGTTPPETPSLEILPPDESWGGATRGEWNARGWQRVVSLPPESDCGSGQFGPMFFLTGSFGAAEETCVVAEGIAIFVVVTGAECSTVEPPPYFGRNEEELRACAAAAVDEITDYQASVNGQDIPDLDAYRTTSPLFPLTLPEGNGFGVPAGVAQAVAESYSFIIAPPPPGEYEVAWSTTFPGASEPYGGTVTLIVEAPQVAEPPTT
jgi:hypothetical protein